MTVKTKLEQLKQAILEDRRRLKEDKARLKSLQRLVQTPLDYNLLRELINLSDGDIEMEFSLPNGQTMTIRKEQKEGERWETTI